jgi:transposase
MITCTGDTLMLILALDLGSTCRKSTKTFATVLNTITGELDRTSVPTSPDGLLGLLRMHAPDRIVLEQTSSTGWVVDLLRGAGATDIQVVNPRDEAWRNRTTKTDRHDADLLAKLSVTGQLRTVHVPEANVRQWRCLIGSRLELVRQRTRVKNHIKAILRAQGLQAGAGMWTIEGTAQLTGMARSLDDCDAKELWRGTLHLTLKQLAEIIAHLETITERLDRLVTACPMAQVMTALPGIGPRAAEQIAASLDDPRRFANRKKVGAYFGTVPKVSQSGGTLRHGGITKTGNADARGVLTQIVHASIHRNTPWIADIYHHIKRDDKTRGMRAVQATVRRVTVILWAKCRDYRRAHPDEPLLAASA